MNTLEQRREIMTIYSEAVTSGARQKAVCDVIGLDPKTIQRWNKTNELQCDGRQTRVFVPSNKMTEEERQKIISEANSSDYCEMTR